MSVGRQKTNIVLLLRLTALQQTLKSAVKMPNHCKAVEAGVQVRHTCSCCAHAVLMLCSCCAHVVLMLCSCCAHAHAVLMLMLCSCCAVTGSHLLHRRQVHRSSPGGQIGFIQHILMRRLVVIHEVAVGHICKVLTVAMLAVLWCYHTICDEVRQE